MNSEACRAAITYRITKNTIALLEDDEGAGCVARPVAEGTCIAFDPHVLLSSRILVEVVWDHQTALMFAADLKAIAVRVG
jgi:hypothetical protein